MKTAIEPYLNNTFPATRAEAEKTESSPFTIVGPTGHHVPFADGYRDGDPLVRSELTFWTDEDEDPYVACERVWHAMNADARPNGPRERSLSVGDVLVFRSTSEPPKAYAVAHAGFREIQVPMDAIRYTICGYPGCWHFIEEVPRVLVEDEEDPYFWAHLDDGDKEHDHDAYPDAEMTLAEWRQQRPELFREYDDDKIGPNSRFFLPHTGGTR